MLQVGDFEQRWMVSLTPLLLYPNGFIQRYPLCRRLGGPRAMSHAVHLSVNFEWNVIPQQVTRLACGRSPCNRHHRKTSCLGASMTSSSTAKMSSRENHLCRRMHISVPLSGVPCIRLLARITQSAFCRYLPGRHVQVSPLSRCCFVRLQTSALSNMNVLVFIGRRLVCQ
jgi:hypothetical protein